MNALTLLWLSGAALRVSVLAVPPLLALIIVDLNLSGTEVGILNGIPVALFALAAVPGSLLIARVGAVQALIIGLLIAAAGSALRGVSPNALILFATTAVMATGIAIMQPAMPPVVNRWMPHRIGFATAVYSNGLLSGEIIAVAITIPLILPMVGGDWRSALLFWSIPNVLIALAVYLRQPHATVRAPSRVHAWRPNWRDPLLWKVGFMLSGSTQLYFCVNGFLPSLLLARDDVGMVAPALTALNGGQVPASILLLVMASRWERRRWPPLAATILALVSVFGIVFSSSWWTVAFAALSGFSAAFLLTLVLALPPLLVTPADVSRMSAGVFAISYGAAMLVSVLSGLAWDLTGRADFAFLPIAIGALPAIFAALFIDLSKPTSKIHYEPESKLVSS